MATASNTRWACLYASKLWIPRTQIPSLWSADPSRCLRLAICRLNSAVRSYSRPPRPLNHPRIGSSKVTPEQLRSDPLQPLAMNHTVSIKTSGPDLCDTNMAKRFSADLSNLESTCRTEGRPDIRAGLRGCLEARLINLRLKLNRQGGKPGCYLYQSSNCLCNLANSCRESGGEICLLNP